MMDWMFIIIPMRRSTRSQVCGRAGLGGGGRDLVAVVVVVVVVEGEEEAAGAADVLGAGCAREGDPGSNRPWGVGVVF